MMAATLRALSAWIEKSVGTRIRFIRE